MIQKEPSPKEEDSRISEPGLFLQLQTILEGFAHPFGHSVIAMGIGIKGNGIDLGHIDSAIRHDFFVRCDIHDLANDTAAIFTILVLNELAFQADRETPGSPAHPPVPP